VNFVLKSALVLALSLRFLKGATIVSYPPSGNAITLSLYRVATPFLVTSPADINQVRGMWQRASSRISLASTKWEQEKEQFKRASYDAVRRRRQPSPSPRVLHSGTRSEPIGRTLIRADAGPYPRSSHP
jgi:hypothetical protein